MTTERPSLLIDLRHCYEGFAGIPQEWRLLFAMFARMGLPRLGGVASGLTHTHRHHPVRTPFEAVFAQTQAIVAQDTLRQHWPLPLSLLPAAVLRRLFKYWLVVSESGRTEKLDLKLDNGRFADYLWMRLFEKSLPTSDREVVRRAEFFLTEVGYEYANSLTALPHFAQRRMNTAGWNVFLTASVSPYSVMPGTQAVVRYYDALPLLSPHTVGDPWEHAKSHSRRLARNMAAGAHFICDSEPVRQDLLNLFPRAEPRLRTIPVIVSADLYRDARPEAQVRSILERRRSPATSTNKGPVVGPLPKLFIVVSTLEPRKNYLKLFQAFEQARAMTTEPMQLVIVANKGWRADLEMAELKRLVGTGVFHLSAVPAEEIRVLYSVAHAVIAPSRAEGFDLSGAEGMACGTPVIASDIPVHRWVYGDAAAYFDMYATDALARLIAEYAALPRGEGHLAEQSARGLIQARRYHPDTLAPAWEQAMIDISHAPRILASPSRAPAAEAALAG